MQTFLDKLKGLVVVIGGLLAAILLFLKFKKSDILKENQKVLEDVSNLEGQKQQIDSALKTEEQKQQELKKELGKESSNESNEDLAKYFNNK